MFISMGKMMSDVYFKIWGRVGWNEVGRGTDKDSFFVSVFFVIV